MLNHPKATIAGLALAMVLVAGNSYGGQDRTFVPSTNRECAGASACVSTTFPAVSVPAGQKQSTRLECPNTHPNLWGWDVAHHEHTQIDLVAAEPGAVTVEGINKSDTAGEFAVSLGCSSEPVTPTQMLKTRVLARTDAQQTKKRTQRAPGTNGRLTSAQAENPCTISNPPVPNCEVQTQQGFFMWGWHTNRMFFDCTGDHHFAWNYTYTEEGGSGVTSIGYEFAESPQSFDIWFTNWSIYTTGTITVSLACSRTNSFGGDACGPITSDPGCTELPNTRKDNCSKTNPSACFFTWKEQCSPTDPILDCTIDFLPPAWCQAECPSAESQ